MSAAEENEKTLELLRELPVEVTVDQVAAMVAAIPLATGAAYWLSKISLNSILITSAGTLIMVGSMYLMGSPDAPQRASTPPLAPVTETAVDQVPEPAEVLDLPKAETSQPTEATVLAPSANREATIPEMASEQAAREEEAPLLAYVPEASSNSSPATWTAPVVAPSRSDNGGKTFDLTGFTGVTLHGSLKVVIEQGEFLVTAEGAEDLLDHIDLTVEKNVLHVFSRSSGTWENRSCSEQVTILVRVPKLEQVDLLGSGDIAVNGHNMSGELELGVRGSGDLHFDTFKNLGSLKIKLIGSGDIVGEDVHVTGTTDVWLSGSGDVQITGNTERLKVDVFGSGDLDAGEMQTTSANVSISGSGDATINCTGDIKTTIIGSGDVHNTGSAGGNGQRGVGTTSY
ncbi:MAG TPA: DUF2807 domain-containing protein [Flavobacteriales bacterium]|nr:DUF2807 domain-containing protein [Flavobacteriales bacterium]